MDSNKHSNIFLIVGNGRTGSTWLLSSLDLLHDTTACMEIKWEKPLFIASPKIHLIINKQSSIYKTIDSIPCESLIPTPNKGSKLIFDPDVFYGPEVFSSLEQVIEKNVKLILLKRNYLDTWLSWKVRGVYHEINMNARAHGQPLGSMYETIKDMIKPQLKRLILHHEDMTLSNLDQDSIAYPLIDAVDDLLQAYANDIQALALIQSRGGMVAHYSDIQSKFIEIIKFIGSSSNADQLQNILLNPLTNKLTPLDGNVHPIELLFEISNALDRSFTLTAKRVIPPDIAWRWDSPNTGFIREQGVVNAIRSLGFKTAKQYLHWTVQKPILCV